MSSTVRLGQVVKWPLLMDWSKVLFTGIKRAEWYHLASSGLILAVRALSDDGCFWIGGLVGILFRLICHMHDVVDLSTSSTIIPSLNTLRLVAVKVAMKSSLHSRPIDMRDPDCMWGKTWAVRAAWFKRGFRLISALWMACMMLLSGRMTWGPLLIGRLFLHGVFTLM